VTSIFVHKLHRGKQTVFRIERLYLLNIVIPLCFLLAVPSIAVRWTGLGLIVLTAFVHVNAFKGGQRWRFACLVAEVMLMVAMMIVLSPGYIWMIFYPSSVLGVGFNRKQIRVGLIVICLLLFVLVYLESRQIHLVLADWLMVMAGMVAGVVATYATWWQTQTVKSRQDLKNANLRIERLTQVAERERISRDLHDVMGHELSMITLKSQLVARLIDRDPNRAKGEIADIEQAARQALTRVREYIADIRQPNLQEEWCDAEKLLIMAGIAVKAESLIADEETGTGTIHQVFAMCIREAVTNLVRHSAAKQAYLKLWQANNRLHLTIADDGIGIPGSDEKPVLERRTGAGIIGMRARLATVDGQLAMWSNGTPRTTGSSEIPVSLPWVRGTMLYFTAPLSPPVSQPLEEVQQL
jgi:two-component system, NarL family, sensor histidine kinase DesK